MTGGATDDEGVLEPFTTSGLSLGAADAWLDAELFESTLSDAMYPLEPKLVCGT